MSRRPEQIRAASPGTSSSLVSYTQCLLCTIRGSVHARAEGMAGGKKAEMAVQRTKANAKQCKSNVLKAVSKLKIRGVEGKLGAALIFPDLSTEGSCLKLLTFCKMNNHKHLF